MTGHLEGLDSEKEEDPPRLLRFLIFYLSFCWAFPLLLSILYFLLDPGKPGVWSMGPWVSEPLLWDLTNVNNDKHSAVFQLSREIEFSI